MYKKRFTNLSRVAHKITSSLEIGDILEIIRDEVKETLPHAKEACLLMFDKDASQYTRPLHCSMHRNRISCQLCKRGRKTIKGALKEPLTFKCSYGPGAEDSQRPVCEMALPIYDGDQPLAVMDVIAKDGTSFSEEDTVLLKDLVDLATNALINSRKHWKIGQEKLTMDSILAHLRPFVPETVKQIVEKDPFDPSLEKRDMDVTILFLDIAGYTRISESLTKEKVNFIIEKYFSSFLDVIYSRGGDINETAGDGLMVIFLGPPEESALNACRAALEIHERTTEINRELEGRFDPVHVNMGINSGIASVGMTQFHGASGSRNTFTATGPVTNIAARIGAAAAEGDILVGPDTAGHIKDKLPLHDRGPMAFKNVKDKTQVFSLLRPA